MKLICYAYARTWNSEQGKEPGDDNTGSVAPDTLSVPPDDVTPDEDDEAVVDSEIEEPTVWGTRKGQFEWKFPR
ncbi:hypothetical protein QFC24_003918 [Naganishia onofrii]|uniref:Uncharacterized protein n=1 Tax=Naganishia onofrii TaxID=1851511 RepID=A0ACC2XHK4_9TREE|nr:hypothetical protein QFC24_003918 [Naganishia onofrii]